MAMFGGRVPSYTAPGNLPRDFSSDLLRAVPIAQNNILPGDQPSVPQMPSLPGSAPGATQPQISDMPLWKVALGGLFDSIQNQTGGQGTFIPSLLQQQAFARQQAQRQQQRSEDFEDWRKQYDYQISHQKELTPNEFDRRLAAAGILPGTPDYIRLNKEKAENDANPPRLVTMPDGSMRWVGGAASTPPTAPVGKLTPIGGR